MKKIVFILIIIVLIVISTVSFSVFKYNENIRLKENENREYEAYINKEITGAQVATLINKAIDSNRRNGIKLQDWKYVDNEENSIRIEVKFKELEKIISMETIFNNETENFVANYSGIKFKSIQINYHEKTQKISYIKFEQV